MRILEKILYADRRWIFLLVFLCVLIPLLRPLGLPTHVTKPVRDLYTEVDRIPPNGPPLLLSFDYDPSTEPELFPMCLAILRHCFAKNIRVVAMTHYPAGTGLAERGLKKVAGEYDKVNGVDYVNLGFLPGYTSVMLSMGEDIHRTFPQDHYGTPISEIPMMEDVRNYDDIPLLISVSSAGVPVVWVLCAGSRYHQEVGCGTTAVSAAQYYPYLQTGQFVGMLGGLKGAAEYEELVEKAGFTKERKIASIGMDAQSAVHLLMIAFLIVGNIAYYSVLMKRKRKTGR